MHVFPSFLKQASLEFKKHSFMRSQQSNPKYWLSGLDAMNSVNDWHPHIIYRVPIPPVSSGSNSSAWCLITQRPKLSSSLRSLPSPWHCYIMALGSHQMSAKLKQKRCKLRSRLAGCFSLGFCICTPTRNITQNSKVHSFLVATLVKYYLSYTFITVHWNLGWESWLTWLLSD